jgi:NAD(P)-dependent dehydrogenase (short-subunit alcohol dehydrogenase family)
LVRIVTGEINVSILAEYSLDGKVSIVTGGYGNLGKAMTEGLAEAGSTVVVCDRNIDDYEKAFEKHKPANTFFVEIDISSTKSIRRAFKHIRNRYGSIDVLVNNAFYSKTNMPEKMTDEEWSYSIDGTLSSVFRCIREVVPYMQEQHAGAIMNISSMYGIVSPDFAIYDAHKKFLNPPSYGAAKAGIIQLTKYCAVYFAKDNIRVNCVSPGAFPSPAVQRNRNFVAKLRTKVPLNRIGKPDDLKGIIVFLSSGASSYITGQNIVVDGGWTLC